MADTINKPKLQLRTGNSFKGDKTPSPATKLLISHGRPNFTIQRSPKVQQNGNANPLSPPITNGANNFNSFKTLNNNNNDNNNNNEISYKNANGNNINNNDDDFVIKSTKLNGAFNLAKVTFNDKQPHQQSEENEAAKVVLRRTKAPEPPLRDDEDATVPEFIRRQRRIQERLAKENILDFEKRRSGYFTHVMISPSSTTANRTSFSETMSSPAIVPAFEIPPPLQQQQQQHSESIPEENGKQQQHSESIPEENDRERIEINEEYKSEPIVENIQTNGHVETVVESVETELEEEEVAKAIEEVNRAVAGEDVENEVVPVVVAVTSAFIETTHTEEHHFVEETTETIVQVNGVTSNEVEVQPTTATVIPVATTELIEIPIENGIDATAEAAQQNGNIETITISHTNALDTPSIPAPDPSGALGVNYEPKTVVSFSRDLGEPNKYPDTVKIVNGDNQASVVAVDEELQELTKLKFEIKGDNEDVQVTSVLKAE